MKITMAISDKVVVRLTPDQRRALAPIVRTGVHPAAMRRGAHILLKTDAAGPDAWTDGRIAEALDTTRHTVSRVRQKFVAEGLDATLHRKRPTGRQYRKLEGKQEAPLVAIACSPPPQGRARWTMKLLAGRLVELEVVASIDPATVWRTLKKTRSSPGHLSHLGPPRTAAPPFSRLTSVPPCPPHPLSPHPLSPHPPPPDPYTHPCPLIAATISLT
jgi:transposase